LSSAHIEFTELSCKPVARNPLFPYDEGMELSFTPEQLAQLDRIATNAGTDAQHLVKNAALRLLEDDAEIPVPAPRTNGELPLFHLGGVGSLHRRDIYDDAR